MSKKILQEYLMDAATKAHKDKDLDLGKKALIINRCASGYAKLTNTQVKAIRVKDKLVNPIGNISKTLNMVEFK